MFEFDPLKYKVSELWFSICFRFLATKQINSLFLRWKWKRFSKEFRKGIEKYYILHDKKEGTERTSNLSNFCDRYFLRRASCCRA